MGLRGLLRRGGHTSPNRTRNKEWSDQHVNTPIDDVQIGHERLRLDGVEWGVTSAELETLRRLTPQVFRAEKDSPWHVGYDRAFPPNEATTANGRYCLDRAISMLLGKPQPAHTERWPRREMPFALPTIYIDAAVFGRASQQATVVHGSQPEYDYSIGRIVTGFDPKERFDHISGSKRIPNKRCAFDGVYGYLLVQEHVIDS